MTARRGQDGNRCVDLQQDLQRVSDQQVPSRACMQTVCLLEVDACYTASVSHARDDVVHSFVPPAHARRIEQAFERRPRCQGHHRLDQHTLLEVSYHVRFVQGSTQIFEVMYIFLQTRSIVCNH